MNRRLTALLALVAVAIIGVSPSHAATKPKPKPKPNIVGAYDVTLDPDPTEDVVNNVRDGCSGLTGKGTNNHPFTVPAKGKLTVHLVSPDPTPDPEGFGTDWDLWIMGTDGSTIDKSTGTNSDEQTVTTFTAKTSIIIQVCNIAGETSGHVSYVFKYA